MIFGVGGGVGEEGFAGVDGKHLEAESRKFCGGIFLPYHETYCRWLSVAYMMTYSFAHAQF